MRSHLRLAIALPAIVIPAACAASHAATEGTSAVRPLSAAERPPDAELPIRALRALVDVIDSGDTARVARFAEGMYGAAYLAESGGVTRAVQRWSEIHTLYGPLVVDTLVAADSLQARAWLRGCVTRAWLDLRVVLGPAAPHPITRVGLGRGVRPPFADGRAARVSRGELPGHLARVLREMSREGYFSGSVAVWSGGGPVFEAAYGMEDRQAGRPNTAGTRFDLASVGKMFTAVAALQLAESGRLDLDAPVGRYVPSLPARVGERITTRQLLEHSSGLGEIGPALDSAMAVTETVSQMVRLLTDTTLAFAPGTRFAYSNRGYLVLGAVIEAASGADYFDYVRDHVFRPAGMRDSGFFRHDSAVARRAVPYTRYAGLRGGFVPGPARPGTAVMDVRGGPAGGAFSTAGDLARFGDALLAGRLVTARSLAEMTRGRAGHPWGYGVDVGGRPGSFGHRGGAPGASTYLWIHPASRTVVAVLGNDDAGANLVGDYVSDLVEQW